MELTHVILGPVITEKAELLKTNRVYALKVAPDATKVDVKNALRAFYDVNATSVRVMRAPRKVRMAGVKEIEKRHPCKKVMVTLAKDSKALDLAQFKTA